MILKLLRNIKELQRSQYSKRVKSRIDQVGVNFRVREFNIMNGRYIKIGNDFLAMNRCRVEAWVQFGEQVFQPSIVIGNNVSMNFDCHIGAINEIRIGNNVLMGSKVFITDHAHGNGLADEISIPPNKRPLNSKGPVIIEDNVWIGEGVVVLPNVHIGYGSVIGANAVVTKDIPARSVAGGVPARVLRSLDEER